jgi:L-alanine-DL-glutamate epimerase-like enolase superfamily enzyme
MVGPEKLKGDLIDPALDLKSGHLDLPEGPGLGVTLSKDALARYAEGVETGEKKRVPVNA